MVAASSPVPGTPNRIDEICPLVPVTACMASRKTAPAIIGCPKMKGMVTAMAKRPPRPGTAPKKMPMQVPSISMYMAYGLENS